GSSAGLTEGMLGMPLCDGGYVNVGQVSPAATRWWNGMHGMPYGRSNSTFVVGSTTVLNSIFVAGLNAVLA
ncbi:MAG: hypothetical protein M1356_10285, partial [Gammaproteobacteria bacterium]|nr:hypothetical protein [Gammaproteobacteria bacterium]